MIFHVIVHDIEADTDLELGHIEAPAEAEAMEKLGLVLASKEGLEHPNPNAVGMVLHLETTYVIDTANELKQQLKATGNWGRC